MMASVRRLRAWLGPERSWALFLLFAGTGALSLILQAVGTQTSWVIPVQNSLILIWLVGTMIVIIGRLSPEDRRSFFISVAPALVGLLLMIFFPQFGLWFFGVGVGWLIISRILYRRSIRQEYRRAIRHLRRSEYGQAIAVMNDLIKTEPDDGAHYRFRAELHRLNGDSKHAVQDYRRVIDLEPEAAIGYNGLSEVYLQDGDLEQALTYARQAYEREERVLGNWVTPHNLGMIEDRLGHAEDAIRHLQEALRCGASPSRHVLLIHFWLARAYAYLGQTAEAEREINNLRRHQRGLKEWQTILESDQADTLRDLMAADLEQVGRIFGGAGLEVFTDEKATAEVGG